MKIYILLFLLIAGLASCKVFSFSGRPDPNTSTSGTLGSVKATNGVLPLGESNSPRLLDTLLAKH
jgi:hypothetical protein